MSFSFQHTEYLPGLAVVLLLVALFWQVLHWKKNTAKKIGDPKLVEELIWNYSPGHFMVKFCLACLALAAIILGAANLQKPGSTDKVNRKGVDVVIALDVSKSMLAEDVKPSRLEKAREFLYHLMDQLQNDRLGIVLFAGRAYMQMPLTTDHGAARMYIQQAGPDAVPTQGTVIAEALRMSNSAFNSKERKYKAIVLITDGEDHDPDALTVSKQLAGDGVMINTVGIGSPQGAPIMDPSTNTYKKDDAGNTIISKLNEPELQQLAADTKGVYVDLNDIDAAVSSITKQLDTIAGDSLEDNAFKEYTSYFQWFLAIAFLLLVAEFFFPESKFKNQ